VYRFDVCLREIIALEKKRFASTFCKSIGTAVADIQSRRVSPLAILSPGNPCNFELLGGQWHNFNSCREHRLFVFRQRTRDFFEQVHVVCDL